MAADTAGIREPYSIWGKRNNSAATWPTLMGFNKNFEKKRHKPMTESHKSNIAWSYSALDLFKLCPHKYYRLKVKKDIVEPAQEHLRFGLAVHKAAEEYVRDDIPIPKQYAEILAPLKKLRDMEGEKLCEHKLGLTRDLTPCEFGAKDVWWRGIADLIVLRGDKAFVVDYKTSKSAKYADTKQLEILALALFKHYPHIDKVKGGLLFVVANDFVKTEYTRDKAGTYWGTWIEDVNRLEKAADLDVWNPRPNFTCRNFCAVKDCVHNGRGW